MQDGERLPTPVDNRGLVDHRALIDQSLPHSRFVPQKAFEDTHHVYWRMGAVLKKYHDEDLAYRYRELPINKILMPRYLHEGIHESSIPPELPDNEVMAYRIEAWNVARTLFQRKQEMQHKKKAVSSWAVRKRRGELGLPHDDSIGWEWLRDQKARNFPGATAVSIKENQIPPEYRIETDFGELTENIIYVITREAKRSQKHSRGRLPLSALGIELSPAS